MDLETSQELARQRATTDTKALKKVIKDFYRLLNPELVGVELQAAHETFLLSLSALSFGLSKSSRLQTITTREIEGYESEALSIEQKQTETKEKLEVLKEKLKGAQRDRSRALEYDAIAKRIGKLPDRDAGTESKAKLNADISILTQDEIAYTETTRTRQDLFDAIVKQLENMSEAIAEEKNEQERKRALQDEEDEDQPTPPAVPGLNPTAEPFQPTGGTTTGEEMEGVEQEGGEGGGEEGHMEVEEERNKTDEEREEGEEKEEKEEGEMN